MTFVPLNPAELVYSPGTHISEDSGGSTGASPRMLDHSDEGYDVTSIACGGSSKYHIDPPESIFQGSKASTLVTTLSTRPDLDSPLRAEVREKRCHKKICGRATILSSLRGLRSSNNSHSDNRDLNNFTEETMAICGAETGRKRSYDEIDKPAGFVSKFVCGPGSDSGEAIKPFWAPLGAAKDAHQFMTAILDAILGYWRLVNVGILHRDVSYGNVMILDDDDEDDEELEKQEWGKLSMEEFGHLDKIVADSENKLGEVLGELCRGPKGMLSDFDLCVKHSLALNPLKRLLDESESTTSKRRKASLSNGVPLCDDPSPFFDPCPDQKPTNHDQVSQGKAGQRVVDFRTGTPAFMSHRVLMVRPGQKYQHDYIDDIESFFWVIFWSAAAHLDRSGAQTTAEAQENLDSMDQLEFSPLGTWKRGVLSFCEEGAPMEAQLKGFGNAWASDPVFVNTLIPLGKYLYGVRKDISDPLSARSVAIVFSDVVNIIRSALTSGA